MNLFLDELLSKHPLTPTTREHNAYTLIFEIENYVRGLLLGHGIKFYGDKTPLHILITLLDKIPSQRSPISQEDKLKLNRIIDVRNKICHMKTISEREYDLLVECWTALFVKNSASFKVNLLLN
ncbi:hypothetical protein [Halalkalibacter alkalisediminis]|uniref:DUF4145 domain-containing protein n=1 Tax=Halalkalibacter alkalisediminis TaxID=935616 RepID=A0ABV6NFZ5_9BACI|nr:hypothetical protein [Halalkalibacter alkalisediminis]